MRTPKIVFIGAGSMSFGVPTFRDIFTNEKLAGATLCLVDIDAENLERMYALAKKMNEVSGRGLKLEKTTQRRDVLAGADFVINSLAIERCDLAAFEPLVERHLYGGIRRLGSKLTGEYADYFEPEPEK